jgi:hypothetical protein
MQTFSLVQPTLARLEMTPTLGRGSVITRQTPMRLSRIRTGTRFRANMTATAETPAARRIVAVFLAIGWV